MGEWLLSRRDTLIVARHEVPGWRCRKAPVPEGRSKSLSVPNGTKIRPFGIRADSQQRHYTSH
jgi:hypothetical protein